MTRAELLARLRQLDPPTPAASLVQLWTYYESRLAAVENALRAAGIQPLRLAAWPAYPHHLRASDLRDCFDTLENKLPQDALFDSLALSLIKRLDRSLHNIPPAGRRALVCTGIDNARHVIHPLNNFIADTYELRGQHVAWAGRQGRTMSAYARHFIVLPEAGLSNDNEIHVEYKHKWANRYLLGRLRNERHALRIMLWPFETTIDYPAVEAALRPGCSRPEFVTLRDPRNEPALLEEVERALQEAARQRATVLVFPELSISPRVEARVREWLQRQGPDGHPMLTVLGLCHAPSHGTNGEHPSDAADVNEAVLLSADGEELHRHRKLVAYTIGSDDACGERLLTGNTLTVLESPIGNMLIAICLEFFQSNIVEVLKRSHATLFLVPSLSPTTSAHLTAARELSAHQLASSFVCNRPLVPPLGPPAEDRPDSSFFRIAQHKPPEVRHYPDQSSAIYLLFTL